MFGTGLGEHFLHAAGPAVGAAVRPALRAVPADELDALGALRPAHVLRRDLVVAQILGDAVALGFRLADADDDLRPGARGAAVLAVYDVAAGLRLRGGGQRSQQPRAERLRGYE